MRSLIMILPIILLFCFAASGLFPVEAAETAMSKALVLVNEGKNDEAISILKQTIEKNPNEPDAQLLLGMALLEKSEYNAALEALEKALSLKPQSVVIRYTLAMLYEKERKYQQAVNEWKRVLKLSDDKNLKVLAEKHIKQLEEIK